MKKSLRRILSLMLVIAVLMTSMLVSTVGATGDPMQEVLLKALTLDAPGKTAFNAALNLADLSDIPGAASAMQTIFPSMSVADATLALEKYTNLRADQKLNIQASVLVFTLPTISPDVIRSFSTIATNINTELTGSSDTVDNKGIRLIIQIISYLNATGKNGAYVTDVTGDISKILFVYDPTNQFVNLVKSQINGLIDSGAMQTLFNKINGKGEGTSFDKLINYTSEIINASDIIPAERTAFKNNLGSYYTALPVVTPPTGGGDPGTGVPPVVIPPVDEVTEAVGNLADGQANLETTGLEVKEFENKLEAAIELAIEAVGTTVVAPTVSGTTATVTADQIKVADFLAKADAVVAKATELEKLTADSNVTIEKKIVIDVDSKGAATLNVSLPTELLTGVQAKGIQKIVIDSGDVKLDVAPDFVTSAKDAKTVSFQINKVAVTDELKATMNDEQKAMLASNATVYDFNFSTISATGTETKITDFDKSITIKIKYSLKAGENKDHLTVLFLGDDGEIQNMTGRYDETLGEIIFVTNHFSAYVIKNLVKSFDDVAANAWYRTQTESLASKGIVAGVTADSFKPNANITRAEFMTMLVKAKGVYDVNATCNFSDVSKEAWYYTYVASAVKAGIASGVGDSKFAPNSVITRQEMAVMIANALGEKTVTNVSSYLKATDASLISAYAKNGMALCVKNEFMVGSGNKLDPKGNSTRGMAAVVVYKYFNFIY